MDAQGRELVHPESPPGWTAATNNQTELQACIEMPLGALGRGERGRPEHYGSTMNLAPRAKSTRGCRVLTRVAGSGLPPRRRVHAGACWACESHRHLSHEGT